MHERLPRILSADGPVVLRLINRVCAAVVLDDVGVVDGDVGRAMVEVVDRVAALAHHPGHQALGAPDGVLRGVDELRLHALPRRRVFLSRLGGQLDDVELLALLLALDQLGLCGPMFS